MSKLVTMIIFSLSFAALPLAWYWIGWVVMNTYGIVKDNWVFVGVFLMGAFGLFVGREVWKEQ